MEERQAADREDSEENTDWEIQSNAQPFINYRRLAIEVATRLAPDLQETLDTTIQFPLLMIQSDVKAPSGRLTELEHCVSKRTSLSVYKSSPVGRKTGRLRK